MVIFSHIPKTGGTSIVTALGLKNYKKKGEFVTIRHAVLRDLKLSGFKFTFTRNPYSRAVSLYFHNKKWGRIIDDSFLAFCRNLGKYSKMPGRYSEWMSKPQSHWLAGIDWNFIGKVERIESDFKKLLQLIDRTDVELPHKNRGIHDNWRNYYCPESREIISNHFHSDFELGYKK